MAKLEAADKFLAAILKVKPTADMPRQGGPHPFKVKKATKPKGKWSK